MGFLVQIPFKIYIGTVSMLPFSAFVICILWSILKNYEESTSTHCHVQNYLPSISTAVGTFFPQKYIWRMCIALHCTPRILIAVMYYNYFRNTLPKEYFWQ
ncbi:Post-GPI attachment to proteins factor 2, partial [Stegodyphus mimosarum]